jgi:hypothetical protein
MQEFILGNSDKQNPPPLKHFDLSNYVKKYFMVFLLCVAVCHFLQAQSKIENTRITSDQALKNAINIYKQAIGKNAMIFTGKYYTDRQTGITGHPYFLNDDWEPGTIIYDKQKYDSIEMKYNIYEDILLVKYVADNGYVIPIQLYSRKIEEFQIHDHRFVNNREDSSSDLDNGFSDILYDGKIAKAVTRRKKEISSTQNSGQILKKYVNKDTWYIQINHELFEVKGKKSILDVLSDKKNEIKSFMNRNKSRYRKNQDLRLKEVVEYYHSIDNQTGT